MEDALKIAATAAPHDPGVYVFLDGRGGVLYVGKAGDLHKRLQQHAKVGPATSHLHRRYDETRDVRWRVTETEEVAAWLEADVIYALEPQFNAPVVRRGDRTPYLVVTDARGLLRFTIRTEVGVGGKSYGCFPHLGKGLATRLGIACSDGYVAFLRILWAASGEGAHTPTTITRSAPPRFDVAVDEAHRKALHSYLSGVSTGLLDDLSTDRRPDYMQPALGRDREAAYGFFLAGPRRVRELRLRHRVPPGPISGDDYRRMIGIDVAPLTSVDCANWGGPETS